MHVSAKAVRLTAILGLAVLATTVIGVVGIRLKRSFVLAPLASFKDCPGRLPIQSDGFPGDHAIVADGGEVVALQCSDGTVLTWQEGGVARKFKGHTLFNVASTVGGVSPELQCSYHLATDMCGTKGGVAIPGFLACQSPGVEIPEPPDCEVIDHPGGGSIYVMRNLGEPGGFVAAASSSDILVLGVSERPGVLMPRIGRAKDFVYISNRALLMSLSLATGRTAVLAAVPGGYTPWGNSESEPEQVAYSDAYDLMIVSFGGSFLGSKAITFVRAYTSDGLKKWGIGGNVVADKSGFSGDFAEVHVFGGGRYATFNRGSNRRSFDIIDLKDGDILATFEGWPIAVASKADRMLVKKPNGDYSYFEMINKEAARRGHRAP